jgi:hypothetical protein
VRGTRRHHSRLWGENNLGTVDRAEPQHKLTADIDVTDPPTVLPQAVHAGVPDAPAVGRGFDQQVAAGDTLVGDDDVGATPAADHARPVTLQRHLVRGCLNP